VQQDQDAECQAQYKFSEVFTHERLRFRGH
jgi:hypothetical protein